MSVDRNMATDAVNKPSITNSVRNENVLKNDAVQQCEVAAPAAAEPKKDERTKKSLPNADEEYVRKFTSGQPIIDQHNPFKAASRNRDDGSAVSSTDTVLDEGAVRRCDMPSSDDFITTEEVLKQSKYVKTYIKNPDPYFVYDPAVLARIKEELNQNSAHKTAKVPVCPKKEPRKKNANAVENTKQLPYKKCSKPNYPDLSNIKIKVGTKLDGSYFSLTEVKSNAKKFDECIKKKKFKAERDLDDDEEEEHSSNSGSNEELPSHVERNDPPPENNVCNDGSFTNTINSEDFRKYLERSGLVLAPRKLLNGAEHVEKTPPKPSMNGANEASVVFPKSAPTTNTSNIAMDSASKEKKLRSSIFHRLLSNNIFASRRRTVPKETVPNQTVTKRIVLERRRPDEKSSQPSLIPRSPAHGKADSKNSVGRNQVHLSTNKHSKEASLNPPTPQTTLLRGNSILRNNTMSRNSLPQKTIPPNNADKLPRRDSTGVGNNLGAQAKPSNGLQSVVSDDFRELYKNSLAAIRKPVFQRSNSLGSKAISQRTRELGNMRMGNERNANPREANSTSILFNSLGPGFTSTPKKKTDIQRKETANGVVSPTPKSDSKNEWMRLREMKENVDREMYSKIIKPRSSNNENVYEHLELHQLPAGKVQTSCTSLEQGSNFVRGSPKRNTFCGSTRDRNYVDFVSSNVQTRAQGASRDLSKAMPPVRGNTQYSVRPNPSALKSYHTITREEIIQRVQQFCRNSMRKLKSQTETDNGSSDGTKLSPVSYVSVETQNEPAKHGLQNVHFRASSLNGSKDAIPIFVKDHRNYIYPLKNRENYSLETKKLLNAAGGPWKRNAQCFSENIYVTDATTFQKRPNPDNTRDDPQKLLQPSAGGTKLDEDWQNENKAVRQQSNEQANDERRRTSRREDPRRHTMGGDMLQYGVMQNQPQQRSMDLEMGMGLRTQKNKKNQPIRSYAPINQGPLFDEDPGIMSEVETASTGFRRGGKQRSSLPVVRTPSKTLERPLGLVFLQYRSETKRALLPNEITSIDTVRALFVRSFPRQLTMVYLEGPNVKIYIHDPSKDMFYELEDVRSHLREIRDRSVLRLFESNEVAAPPQVLPGGTGIPQQLPQAAPVHWDQDQSYFSEPEFDSEYQHQHIHKSKPGKQAPYYVGTSQTLPRGMYSDCNKIAMGAPAKPLRSYGSRGNMGTIFPYPPDQLYSIPDGYTSSPERGTRGSYEEPYYSQYGTRANVVAPIIDEENSEVAIPEDQYALYGIKVGPGRIPRTANQMYDPTRPEDLHRIRVEHMERQLANLTGLVQKALVNQNPQIAPVAVPTLNPNYLGVPAQCRANGTGEDIYIREKAPKLGKSSCHKSVSFEKSVSFSDDIQGVPKSHSPQHAADTKPTKPAIKSSTLPRTSSQERDRLKPPPPPKPIALTQTHSNYRADIALAPEVYNHLRGLQKKAKDLRMEVRTLRRLSQAQAVAVREDIKDAFMRIRATLLASSGYCWDQQADQEKTRISREEELYKQEVIRLEKDLSDLESSVEGLRGEVINRRTRVNMAAVEDMALVLSRASKTVAELKMRFPGLSNGIRNLLSTEMEKVVREEKFLKEEPDRLESALRRCKKLTGTLVTLKRLASVQEQRLPPNEPTPNEEPPRSAEISTPNKPIPSPRMGPVAVGGGVPPENALDALLDELQTFAKPNNQNLDFRPDDSTSDDSSQAILNTVTTQIPQACLFNPNEPNAAQLQMRQELENTPANTQLDKNIANANMLQVNPGVGSLRRLHSYPSGSDTDTSPPQHVRLVGKPPVPERNAELLSKVGNKRIPPPPPPRTSSRSPLASPTSPNVPHRMPSVSETEPIVGNGEKDTAHQDASGNSSGNESGNDQAQRQVALERRHQELLKKQKMLQEQYQRLQQMSKMPAVTMPPPPSDIMQLKKTGSESNLPQKMGLCMSTATGSMKNLNTEASAGNSGLVSEKNEKNLNNTNNIQLAKEALKETSNSADGPNGASQLNQNDMVGNVTTIKQVYETEIL